MSENVIKRKLRIIIPIWNFTKAGGIKVLSRLANEFENAGHEVIVICYCETDEPYYSLNCEIQYVDDKGNAVARRDSMQTNNFVWRRMKLLMIPNALKRAINRLASDHCIVLANYNRTAYPVYQSNVINKFYYIQAYEVWDENATHLWRRITNQYVKRTYTLDLIRIVNAEIYKNYKEIKSDYVIPPGIDLSVYYQKTEHWDGNRPFVIGCIGRKEKWKGSDDVARAVDILQKKGLNIQFKVAFNPMECADFELVFPDGDEKLAEFYRQIDVMVAPGHIQLGAIHYPVIEAMACGTSVITTGYYPADENNAYIVPVACPEKIAEAIEEIMDDYDTAMRKIEVASKQIGQFDWSIVSQKMLDIFYENMK